MTDKPTPPAPSAWGSRNVEVFEKVEQVGEGTYGQVYKARNKETGEIVALKRVRMDNEREGFPITAIREIKILKILNHKNIVCLKEIVTSKASEYNHGKGSIYMVMEFADHDLCGLTDAGIRFTEAQIKCYMKQLLEGLAYCHKNRILHRDIKGSNLLITNEGQLKLADFGLARPFDDNNRAYTNRVITLWYRPPELLLGAQQYGPAIDLWSVGCIFAEILNRKPILPGSNEFEQLSMIFQLMGTPDDKSWPGVSKLQHYSLFRQHQSNRTYASKFNERFGHLPESAQSLLSKLLAMNPEDRISAKDALDHDYFWEAPFPARPEELPKYTLSSHEFTAKKRRQAAATNPQPAAAAAASAAAPPPQQGGPPPGHHAPPPHYAQQPPPGYRPPHPHHAGPPQHAYGGGPPPPRGPPGAGPQYGKRPRDDAPAAGGPPPPRNGYQGGGGGPPPYNPRPHNGGPPPYNPNGRGGGPPPRYNPAPHRPPDRRPPDRGGGGDRGGWPR